ncbi:hypothetical protein BDV95DRAFT_668614 [Massariosphaeria phaeospora]|uniref:Uncharacterized protein n=1 Tax=Massariosphaeria phaeospora TaxID=100035 RepID=A0A7C8I7I7_9PLEO|nr:hypothetical protein BDV95DRAFT_668614 [Massariosphaeria phaeospora]
MLPSLWLDAQQRDLILRLVVAVQNGVACRRWLAALGCFKRHRRPLLSVARRPSTVKPSPQPHTSSTEQTLEAVSCSVRKRSRLLLERPPQAAAAVLMRRRRRQHTMRDALPSGRRWLCRSLRGRSHSASVPACRLASIVVVDVRVHSAPPSVKRLTVLHTHRAAAASKNRTALPDTDSSPPPPPPLLGHDVQTMGSRGILLLYRKVEHGLAVPHGEKSSGPTQQRHPAKCTPKTRFRPVHSPEHVAHHRGTLHRDSLRIDEAGPR